MQIQIHDVIERAPRQASPRAAITNRQKQRAFGGESLLRFVFNISLQDREGVAAQVDRAHP
ncbi:MAG: hypothetical protein ACMG6S_29085, partial [Byssovorax sp.]